MGALLFGAVACSREQRQDIDSAAGSAVDAGRAMLSVIDVDMGKSVGADKKIVLKTDDFMPKDTIFASVHTSGTAQNSAVVGRWVYQDTTTISEATENVTTDGDAYTVFKLSKPAGLSPGKYTLRVLIDGREVRAKDVTVK